MAKPKTILIADDHPGARMLIRDLLQGLNCQFLETCNGEETIHAYNLHRPDLVIMDVEMPVKDGIEATKEIVAAHPTARIVIVTQHDYQEIREHSDAIGATAFLAKDALSSLPQLLDRI